MVQGDMLAELTAKDIQIEHPRTLCTGVCLCNLLTG